MATHQIALRIQHEMNITTTVVSVEADVDYLIHHLKNEVIDNIVVQDPDGEDIAINCVTMDSDMNRKWVPIRITCDSAYMTSCGTPPMYATHVHIRWVRQTK